MAKETRGWQKKIASKVADKAQNSCVSMFHVPYSWGFFSSSFHLFLQLPFGRALLPIDM